MNFFFFFWVFDEDDVVHRSDDRELPRVLPLAHAPLVQGLPRNPNPNPSTPPYPGARCLSVLVAHRPPVAVPEGGERAPGDEGHGFRCLAISAEALVLERGRVAAEAEEARADRHTRGGGLRRGARGVGWARRGGGGEREVLGVLQEGEEAVGDGGSAPRRARSP